jgi:CDP-2,3-bis-(O-geranylgeranyl)-sn-glycerol synthase
MFKFILESLYFLAPAGFATLTPQLAAHFKILEPLNKPIDGGRTFRGHHIFGAHKTIRGYIFGVLTGLLTGFIQYLLSDISLFKDHSLINYSDLKTALLAGALLGLGALVGDSIKSFFKRQFGIAPGKPWFIFDQIDFIVGASIFALPVIVLSMKYYVGMIIIYFLVHILTTSIGYLIGVKESWV